METQDDGSGLQDWIKYLYISFRFHLSKSSGARFSKSRKTTTCLFCKAGLFICCKGSNNESNCYVSCLETPSF